ncbi:MAG TPA: PIG-L family deacetylase [Aggregatilineales bacterium]|nr:PIG-L family deacetylase [Aggregatilineales bacterium]
MHLFLSPHFDDAALACGAQISTLTRKGERVMIYTVMAGDPPVNFKHTQFTRQHHERWALGENPAEGRQIEDRQAAQLLGAEVQFGPYPDAIYRIDPQGGGALYSNDAALMGIVNQADPVKQVKRAAVIQALLNLLGVKSGNDVIHAPLGVGRHVDHQIVRDMGLAMAQWRPDNRVYFYEDYPYTRLGDGAIQMAVRQLNQPAERVTRRVTEHAIAVKIAAIECYKSQLSGLGWLTKEAMAADVRADVEQAEGEREWLLLRE